MQTWTVDVVHKPTGQTSQVIWTTQAYSDLDEKQVFDIAMQELSIKVSMNDVA
jgi:hypothetical protein